MSEVRNNFFVLASALEIHQARNLFAIISLLFICLLQQTSQLVIVFQTSSRTDKVS